MYLNDDIQKTLRSLGKITDREVVKKEGDIYVAFNVLTNESRILTSDHQLIESLSSTRGDNQYKNILKG
tara:strand:+ start:288 stop:494 length:207 start_codon:yes stop_codon:yes gene_type:complete